jgi:hypothetical protein
MGTVVVLSADKIMEYVNNGVITGSINVDGELVLTKQSGASVNLGNIKDHGILTGLSDDDHPQYALADGSRGEFASVAQGERADAARLNYMAIGDVDGGNTDGWFEEFTVTDDGTATGNWVNRIRGYFRQRVSGSPVTDGLRRLVFWFNEYLELRLAPAKHNTVALRIFIRDNPSTQTNARDPDVPLLELMDDRTNRNKVWGLYPNGNLRIGASAVETAYTIVLGPADPVPAGTPANTVIVRTS